MARHDWEHLHPPRRPHLGWLRVYEQLVPHAEMILEKLGSLSEEGLMDPTANALRLQAAMDLWKRMGGPRARDISQRAGEMVDAWFQVERREPLDSLTVRPGEPERPPFQDAQDRPWNAPHELEGALLGVLVPFVAFQAATMLCPGDKVEDLFIDGMAALLVGVRTAARQRGDLERDLLDRVRPAIYDSRGNWRSCGLARAAFWPFPAAYRALARRMSPHLPAGTHNRRPGWPWALLSYAPLPSRLEIQRREAAGRPRDATEHFRRQRP